MQYRVAWKRPYIKKPVGWRHAIGKQSYRVDNVHFISRCVFFVLGTDTSIIKGSFYHDILTMLYSNTIYNGLDWGLKKWLVRPMTSVWFLLFLIRRFFMIFPGLWWWRRRRRRRSWWWWCPTRVNFIPQSKLHHLPKYPEGRWKVPENNLCQSTWSRTHLGHACLFPNFKKKKKKRQRRIT